jgi:hypothetical protein
LYACPAPRPSVTQVRIPAPHPVGVFLCSESVISHRLGAPPLSRIRVRFWLIRIFQRTPSSQRPQHVRAPTSHCFPQSHAQAVSAVSTPGRRFNETCGPPSARAVRVNSCSCHPRQWLTDRQFPQPAKGPQAVSISDSQARVIPQSGSARPPRTLAADANQRTHGLITSRGYDHWPTKRRAASSPGFRGGVGRRGSGFDHPNSRPRGTTPHPG